jgi:hypothetical protein
MHQSHSRADRLIRFIDRVGYERVTGLRYRGPVIQGVVIRLEDLSDECLERIAESVRWHFWSTRKINRENRAIWAARRTA